MDWTFRITTLDDRAPCNDFLGEAHWRPLTQKRSLFDLRQFALHAALEHGPQRAHDLATPRLGLKGLGLESRARMFALPDNFASSADPALNSMLQVLAL